MRILLLAVSLFICGIAKSTTYYLSPTGSDSNPGTITQPFKTFGKLASVLNAGDIAYIRGGTYTSTLGNGAPVHLLLQNLTGTASNPILIQAYPGELPVFDFVNIVPTTDYVYAMQLRNSSYVHIKGQIIIKNLKQVQTGQGISRGFSLSNSDHCTIEWLEIFNMAGTGFIIEDGSADNLIMNCDSHHNGDGLSDGGTDAWDNADAFSCTGNPSIPSNTSTRNTFKGCRGWLNSDDGWDFFGTNGVNNIDNCWAFWNGVKPWGPTNNQPNEASMTTNNYATWHNNSAYIGSSGEGFKLGPAETQNFTLITRFVNNCVSFENRGTGYASNSISSLTTKHQFYNNIAYKNDNDGFSYGAGWSGGVAQVFNNNWAWNNNVLISGGDLAYDGLGNNMSNNVWMTVYQNNYGNLPGLNITNADFLSVVSAGMDGARQADGSLPVLNFLKLSPASDLINKGIDVGLPFNGTAPDLGAFEYSSATNIPPTANAGADQAISLPISIVTLSGSGTDPDGTITAYQWRKLSGPLSITITNPLSATTTVTALLLPGVYEFELKVTDNGGATDLDTMSVVVNGLTNQPPSANAGTDQTITLPANSTSLNGTGTDTDGTISSYLWTKISGPASGSITNANAASTSVTALVQGVYQFELKVTDNLGATGTDIIQVTVNPAPNQGPNADAGADQAITLPVNTVTLSGSGTDPDGTITAYLWTKISGPTGGTITNANTASTSVTGLVQGVYKFQLRVTDNSGATDLDTMQVTVNPAVNQGPTSNAGNDQNITLPTNSASLNGSGTDPDGTITAYLWTKISGPASGTITNSNNASTTVTGLTQGVYKFQLRVTDNSGATDLDTMQVTVNPAVNQGPTANANIDQTITLPTNSVTLAGSGTDPDGTITAYLWTKISGPASGTITNPNNASTTVTGLTQGVYKFQLRVTDNSGATDLDTMQVTVNVANQVPTANAGLDQNITLPTNTASLNGSGTDPDGTITAYLWTKISGPAAGTITNANTAASSVTGLVQGIYKFQLRVTDNSGATDLDTMQVAVNPAVNQAPTANAGLDLNITLPTNSVSLNGSGTDPDGTITAYLWTKISGPANGTITNANSATTSVTGLVQGVYKFQLRVTDNSGATDLDTMQVTVNPAVNQGPTANANIDQTITLPANSVTLAGSGTDPDGTITAYLWTKISGPAAGTITNANTATTSVTGLVQGVYKFQLRVTDNSGATDTDTMQVTVNPAPPPPNVAPVANAGLDQNITLPTNTVTLSGTGTDPDGTIVSYLWTKVSGPASGTITNANTASTSVTGLIEGVYQFQLKVTDNSGATGTDIMQVTVNPAPPPPNVAPTANAGADSSIYLPVNTITLSGSGTDPDGFIASYSWNVISGGPYLLSNANNAITDLSELELGIYEVELTVTDNSGATGKDTITITVGAGRTQAEKDDVKILGNPVQNILTAEITSTSVHRITKVVLFDIVGNVLVEKDLWLNQLVQQERIDMTRYSRGSYILQVYFDKKTPVTKKIIKL